MAEKITIYHNPKCSKSRQTLALIEEAGVTPEVVLYLENPPSQKRLKEIVAQLGVAPAAIIRTKEAKEEGVAYRNLSDAALIKAMAEHPRIIERPIVVKGQKAVMGRPPENVKELL
jgi:arsenate reductase